MSKPRARRRAFRACPTPDYDRTADAWDERWSDASRPGGGTDDRMMIVETIDETGGPGGEDAELTATQRLLAERPPHYGGE